jgi:hypothetical protein
MKRTGPDTYRWIGFHLQGDLGPYTLYTTRRGKTVAYPRSPPTTPTTPRQQRLRNSWRVAAALWTQTTPADRAAWETAARAANYRLTGYNLFVHTITTTNKLAALHAERVANETLRIAGVRL